MVQPSKPPEIKYVPKTPVTKPFSELSPISKMRLSQMAQIRRLQRRLIAKAEDKNVTGATLAQICRSWSLLESQRQRLKGLLPPSRLADASPATTEKFSSVANLPDAPEAIMLDDDSLIDDQTSDSLPIVIRKPPGAKG